MKQKFLVCSIMLALSSVAYADTFDNGIPADWTGIGSYGVLGADGDVTASPLVKETLNNSSHQEY